MTEFHINWFQCTQQQDTYFTTTQQLYTFPQAAFAVDYFCVGYALELQWYLDESILPGQADSLLYITIGWVHWAWIFI